LSLKLRPECIGCLLTVRLNEIARSSKSEDEALRKGLAFVERAVRLMKESIELTRLATKLYRCAIELCPEIVDYYRELKRSSVKEALSRLEGYKSRMKGLEGYERFELAVKIAIAGNMLDSGVAGHEPRWLDPADVARTGLVMDSSKELYELVCRGGRRILYLLDNAGEAVLDYVLAEELERLGNAVVVAVKSEPGFQNDITMDDVVTSGLLELFERSGIKVVETGTSASSIHLDEVSCDFKRELGEADLVIAKGMAHYEYIADEKLSKPVFFLLTPKCEVVSNAIGAPRGSFVVTKKDQKRQLEPPQ